MVGTQILLLAVILAATIAGFGLLVLLDRRHWNTDAKRITWAGLHPRDRARFTLRFVGALAFAFLIIWLDKALR